MSALAWTQDDGVVRLSGAVTERSDLAGLEVALRGARVVDLAGVEYVNSFGVREWLAFVERLKGHPLEARRCSPAVVHQINSIQGFAGELSVRSVMAPYLCPGCGRYEEVEVELDGSATELDEIRPCPACGDEMEFDELPDAFLAFTRR